MQNIISLALELKVLDLLQMMLTFKTPLMETSAKSDFSESIIILQH